MNILAPVSSIMTTSLITVRPTDKLQEVKAIFDSHKIHHLPVVEGKKLVGIISKTDLLYFVRGMTESNFEHFLNTTRLKNYHVQDIMTKGVAFLEPEDRIAVALEIFKENLFHAIPIVDNKELVGIITTYDIIACLADEKQSSSY